MSHWGLYTAERKVWQTGQKDHPDTLRLFLYDISSNYIIYNIIFAKLISTMFDHMLPEPHWVAMLTSCPPLPLCSPDSSIDECEPAFPQGKRPLNLRLFSLKGLLWVKVCLNVSQKDVEMLSSSAGHYYRTAEQGTWGNLPLKIGVKLHGNTFIVF